MSDLSTLKKLLKDKALIPIEKDQYNKKYLTLTEEGYSQKAGYSVKINDVPEDAVVIKADKFPSPDTIFKPDKGTCKRADFVIIANTDDGNSMIFIEIKKSKKKLEQIIQQLKGARCFVDYLRSIGREFWNESDFLVTKDYIYRFVSISHIGLNKKPTRNPHPDGKHDSPERLLKIQSPDHLTFKQLL